MKKILLLILASILVAVMGYSGFQLLDINRAYEQEAEIHNRLMSFQPTLSADVPSGANQKIIDLVAKYPDAVGWLTVPGTKINYPFVQGRDNDYYLHHDLDGQYRVAGSLFIDYRSSKDFSDSNTLIFGHHMKNGSMFASLQDFEDGAFFNAHRSGTIFLSDKTLKIDFFAFAVVKPDDAMVFRPGDLTDDDLTALVAHLKSTSRHFRDVDLGPGDQIVTLSTCNYELKDGRGVLVGKLSGV